MPSMASLPLKLNNMRKFFWVPIVILGAMMPHAAHAVALINPLGETDVRVLFGRVISAALSVVGSFALLMVVYGGILWMTSRGDTKMIQKGKDTLTWAVLGLAVIFASYAIVNALITGITTGSVT
jgi:fumarate reductase subunit D